MSDRPKIPQEWRDAAEMDHAQREAEEATRLQRELAEFHALREHLGERGFAELLSFCRKNVPCPDCGSIATRHYNTRYRDCKNCGHRWKRVPEVYGLDTSSSPKRRRRRTMKSSTTKPARKAPR